MAHPEHDRKRQKAPWASGNRLMASMREWALATRRRKRSSHQAGGPTAAPRSLKLAEPSPGKTVGTEGLRRSASRDDFSLAEIDHEADAVETQDKGSKEAAHGGCRIRAHAIEKEQMSRPEGKELSVDRRDSWMTGWMARAKRTGPKGSPC